MMPGMTRTSRHATVLLFLAAVSTFSVGVEARAQSKTGTTVGLSMLIEPSARAAAMGNAGVTTWQEAQSAFYNPGALGHLPGSDVQFTHSQWLAEITYNYAAIAIRTGTANTLFLTIMSLNSGEIDVRTVDQPRGTGERYTANDLAFGLGYSRRITDRFSAGAQVKYWQQTVWHSSANAMALDLGVMYHLPFGTYLGASIANFGTRARFAGRDLVVRYDQDDDIAGDNSNLDANLDTEDWPLPIFFRVGLGMPFRVGANNQLLLAVDAFQPSDNTEAVNLGAEWTFMEIVSLRAGYQYLFQEDNEFGLTLGSGLKYETSGYGLRFDYAWAEHLTIGSTQRFTFGFSF